MHISHVADTINMYVPQGIELSVILYSANQSVNITNTCISYGIESLVISYPTNQLVNPLLWDRSFYSIFFFRLNRYLNNNTKNITCFLLRIITFIKQCKIKDKTMKNISQIGQFLSTIYKAG